MAIARGKIAAIFLTMLGALVPAWSFGQAPATDAELVRVGLVKITGHAPIFVADKLGFFKDEGVKVELVPVRSGAEAQAAVEAAP